MARAKSYLALILAYIATLFYIAAMCTPWWYTKYYIPESDDKGDDSNEGPNSDTFFGLNPQLNSDSTLFDRSNCFIDGSCITGSHIYKNNDRLQWVYTTTLVLMLVGWIPWLIFVHLLHRRANKNRSPMAGRRSLMAITALLTWALILTAIIVFAAGMVKSNGIYNSGGLYGSVPSDGLFGSMPSGKHRNAALGAGLALSCFSDDNDDNEDENDAFRNFGTFNGNGFSNCVPVNGTIGYKWGAHAAWYFALLPLILIPLALLLGLAIKTKETVVTQERTVQRTVTTQPAVVQQPQYVAQPQYAQTQSYAQPAYGNQTSAAL